MRSLKISQMPPCARIGVGVAAFLVLAAFVMDLVAYHIVAGKIASFMAQSMWNKAVFYQAFHGLAFMVWVLYARAWRSFRWFCIVPALWLVGVVCFSGGIYALLLYGEGFWHRLIPWGGMGYLLGWCFWGGFCFIDKKMH